MTPEAAGADPVPGFDQLGFRAFTTTRARGSFNLHANEAAGAVFGRWQELLDELAPHAPRLVVAHQVHGDTILQHEPVWTGWLRTGAADGHMATALGIAMAVTLADCVPVFLAHPRGAAAIVHSGWRGTLLRIAGRTIDRLVAAGYPARELHVYCGPAICGRCYEVSSDVYVS